MNIHQAINIEDIRLLAKKKLPKVAFDFIDGGVDDEIGLRHNREAFKDYQLVPRYLRDVSQCKIAVDIFGQSFSMPIGISPMGLASLFKLGSDSMMAHAAKKFNVPYVMSGSSNHSMEMVAKIAPDHVWFQLYCTNDDKINQDLVRRASDSGIKTLVLTVDVPVNSNRERNRRNGFTRPFKVTPSIIAQGLMHPSWLIDFFKSGGVPMMQNWQPYAGEGASADAVADLFGRLTPSPVSNWKILENIRQWWPGKLLVKGILHPDDAVQAVNMGADGIVVSNHGARQLDMAPSPLQMLSSIRATLPNTFLMMDSGIRRGSDLVIAKCLGADSCLFGRPMMFGAAAAGQQGVDRSLTIIHSELNRIMTQIGCQDFAQLDASYLMALHKPR